MGGAFSAGGNARDGKRALKIRAPELKTQLLKTLRADWPSFMKISSDERGVLLASFAADRLSHERRADLHNYMNRLLNTHPVAAEFGLNRDPARWGVVLAGAQHGPDNLAPLVYALRPPWIPNDGCVMSAAKDVLARPLPQITNNTAAVAATDGNPVPPSR